MRKSEKKVLRELEAVHQKMDSYSFLEPLLDGARENVEDYVAWVNSEEVVELENQIYELGRKLIESAFFNRG